MVEIILAVLFLIPAMLGLAELLHIFKMYILKPTKPVICYKIIILTNDNPLSQVIYETEKYSWHGKTGGASLIFIGSLLDDENLTECRIAAESKGFIFCMAEELKKYLDLI